MLQKPVNNFKAYVQLNYI